MEFFKKTAEEFENYFDEGGSILPFADLEKASRPNKVKQATPHTPLGMPEPLCPEAQDTKRMSGLQWIPTT